jgi:hypothetical protein
MEITGKGITFFIVTQLCSNGWWFCATQTESLAATPFFLIPVLSTALIVIGIASFIFDNWD